MKNLLLVGRVPLSWIAVAAMALPSSALSAQSMGTIRGVVYSSVTGEALEGVHIIVKDPELETITGPDGSFLLSDVPAGPVQIRLELLPDYVTSTEQVPVRPGVVTRVSLELLPQSVILDELLVRGRPAPSDALVRVFRPGEARELTGGGSAVDLLVATFSSVQVNRTSGQAGGGSSILIRGTNSLILSGEPLLYVDGVRMGSPRGQEGAETTIVLNFLDQIPADMVARIEVLRGPSATRFGIGSSNGVILIYTR
jgi:hypothetical protein